jgi:hypothetical protein
VLLNKGNRIGAVVDYGGTPYAQISTNLGKQIQRKLTAVQHEEMQLF